MLVLKNRRTELKKILSNVQKLNSEHECTTYSNNTTYDRSDISYNLKITTNSLFLGDIFCCTLLNRLYPRIHSNCELFRLWTFRPIATTCDLIFYPSYSECIIYVRSWSLCSWYTEMPSEQPNSPASSSVVCLLTCDCCVLSLLDIWRCCPGSGWGLWNLSNTTLSICLSLSLSLSLFRLGSSGGGGGRLMSLRIFVTPWNSSRWMERKWLL